MCTLSESLRIRTYTMYYNLTALTATATIESDTQSVTRRRYIGKIRIYFFYVPCALLSD